jgi:hypothetical protein
MDGLSCMLSRLQQANLLIIGKCDLDVPLYGMDIHRKIFILYMCDEVTTLLSRLNEISDDIMLL